MSIPMGVTDEAIAGFLLAQGWDRQDGGQGWTHDKWSGVRAYKNEAAVDVTVSELKNQWVEDPLCFDIEDTEGFELFHDQLLTYKIRMNGKWAIEREIADLGKRKDALDKESHSLHQRMCDLRQANQLIGAY